HRAAALGRRPVADPAARRAGDDEEGSGQRPQWRLGAGSDGSQGGQDRGQGARRGVGAARAGWAVAAHMSEATAERDANRRQVLYWRLLARLFDPEEQPTLESASVQIVDDLELPVALLDPSISVDNVVQRFPALADELSGLLKATEGEFVDDGGDQVRRAALVSKLLLNVFNTG